MIKVGGAWKQVFLHKVKCNCKDQTSVAQTTEKQECLGLI